MNSIPSIGIDFGTTNSSMAWFDPRTGQAEVILNAEGEAKTPSLVYFGDDETLVGKTVETTIEDVSADAARRDEVFRRTMKSIKRDLISPPRIALPGGRFVRPVDVAAEILKKLKRDAEDGHFHEEVRRAVITCPAEFSALQRQKIEEAGRLAGFEEVVLLEEPVAGALSYARAGLNVGRHVLVYDLGGGTFDLAVLDNEDESFHVAMEPKGMERCGGDDFDFALYDHCDGVAQERIGRPVSLTEKRDLNFLYQCRDRKENFTYQRRGRFSSYLSSDNGPARFEYEMGREEFEGLIDEYIETTVRLTEEILGQAGAGGREVDTVVLVGGSSRVPLVKQMLEETLPVKPLGFDKKDVAVALGAAHYANIRWPSSTKPPPPPPPPDDPTPLDRYRKALETTGVARLDKVQADQLNAFAVQLGLSEEQAARAEREILGDTVEEILHGRYRRAVEMVWADERLSCLEVRWLESLANESGLELGRVSRVESEVMGGTREEVFGRQGPGAEPQVGPGDFRLTHTLAGHSDEVHAVAFSPDGRFLLSGASDGAVRGWNVRTGDPVGTLAGHPGRVSSVAFSPDGSLLASGGFDKTVKVWKLPNGEPFHDLNHSEWVFGVAFGPDGRTLASAGADGGIQLWNLNTGELLRTLTGHSHWVLSVAFTPDGRSLVSGGADGTVRVWDPRTGELVRIFGRSGSNRRQERGEANAAGNSGRSGEHAGWVWSVAAFPDSQFVASGGEDGAVKVWNLRPTSKVGELVGDLGGRQVPPILSVAADPDGRLIFGGATDGKVRAWDLRTGTLTNVLPGHAGGVGAVAAAGPGGLLASGGCDHAVRVWSRQGSEETSPGGDRSSRARPGSPPGGSRRQERPPDLPDAPGSGRKERPPSPPGGTRPGRPPGLPD